MMLIGLNVNSGSCILKLTGWKFTFFLHLYFHFSRKYVAFAWFTCVKKHSAAKSDENIVKGERSIKAAKKDYSTTVVASVHSTGATPVGSVNVTEFWQRQTQPPSFLLLLSHKIDLAIPQ